MTGISSPEPRTQRFSRHPRQERGALHRRNAAAIFDPAACQPRHVVVVDSGSTDGTQDIVRSFPTTLIQIRPDEFTYGFALNLGVANVDAEIVVT